MLKAAKKLWKNEFFKGGIFFTIASFAVNLMNYFFNFLSGRALGPQQYSEITTLFSYVSITSVPTFVLSTFLIQKISSSEDVRFNFAKSLEVILWHKLKKRWYVIAIMMFLSLFVPHLTNLSFVTGSVLIPIVFLSFIATFYGSVMQGLQFFFLYSLMGVFGTFLKLLGALFVMVGFDGVSTIVIFVMLSILLPLGISFFSINSIFKKKVNANLPKLEKKLVSLFYNRQFLIILFSTLALTLLNNADVVWVKKFLDAKEAGIYGSWSIFAKIIFYALGPFIAISFIFFSSQKEKQHNTFIISIICLVVIAIISYIVYTNFSQFIIHIFFGEKFDAVAPFLSYASIFGSLYAGISFINGYYLAKKSYAALIPAILIPIYLILLFFIYLQMSSLMILLISFATLIVILYAIVYLRGVLYTNTKSL